MEELALGGENAEQVIRYYSDMVYRIAFARTGTREDADEVYQDVFLRYVRKKPSFRDEEHRKAWFIRVTVNCCKSLWASAWRRHTEPLRDDHILETSEDIDLYKELLYLPSKYREVIHLFYYEDMSVEEISRALNRKNSTVRTQLTRARGMLRHILKEEDYV